MSSRLISHIFSSKKGTSKNCTNIYSSTCPSFWGPVYNSSLATNTYTFYVGRPLTQPHIFWLIMQNDTCVEMIQKTAEFTMPYKILTPIRVWGLFFIHLRFLAAVTPYVQEKFACLCDFPEYGSPTARGRTA